MCSSKTNQHVLQAKKRAYKANCVQWAGHTSLLELFGEVSVLNGWALVRADQGVVSLAPGSWLVQGENGALKAYSDEVFNIKYEVIT